MPAKIRANGKFSDASPEWLHSVSISCVVRPSDPVDLESPLSVVMQVSALQPFWIAMIIFCWNAKLLKLPLSATHSHVCGTNSHNRRAKGQPGVGVVKLFCDSDYSGWKSFRLLNSTALAPPHISWLERFKGCRLVKVSWFKTFQAIPVSRVLRIDTNGIQSLAIWST